MSDCSTRDRFRPGHPLRGVPAGVATRHGKTSVLEEELGGPGGLRLCTVPVDTDAFGTFAGDRPRPGSAEDVVVAKARAGAREGGFEVGLASEGSFGPDPALPLATVQRELVCLVQPGSGLVVIGRATAVASWAVSTRVAAHEDLRDAARRICALTADPLLVRPDPLGTGEGITREVVGEPGLARALSRARCASTTGEVHVSHDLRAHTCPPRVPVIARAAADLALRLARRCTECGSPGTGPIAAERGLACRWCGTPTDEVRAVVDQCPACRARTRREDVGDHRPRRGDPARCPRCNP